MAQPIPLEVPPRNPRDELRSRLEQAPEQHPEAVLAAYEVLQELHSAGCSRLCAESNRNGSRASSRQFPKGSPRQRRSETNPSASTD